MLFTCQNGEVICKVMKMHAMELAAMNKNAAVAATAEEVEPERPSVRFGLYTVLHKVAVRQEFELSSAPSGTLRAGEIIEVLETRMNAGGQLRLRFEKGWTSLTSRTDKEMLQKYGKAQSVSEKPVAEKPRSRVAEKPHPQPVAEKKLQLLSETSWSPSSSEGEGEGEGEEQVESGSDKDVEIITMQSEEEHAEEGPGNAHAKETAADLSTNQEQELRTFHKEMEKKGQQEQAAVHAATKAAKQQIVKIERRVLAVQEQADRRLQKLGRDEQAAGTGISTMFSNMSPVKPRPTSTPDSDADSDSDSDAGSEMARFGEPVPRRRSLSPLQTQLRSLSPTASALLHMRKELYTLETRAREQATRGGDAHLLNMRQRLHEMEGRAKQRASDIAASARQAAQADKRHFDSVRGYLGSPSPQLGDIERMLQKLNPTSLSSVEFVPRLPPITSRRQPRSPYTTTTPATWENEHARRHLHGWTEHPLLTAVQRWGEQPPLTAEFVEDGPLGIRFVAAEVGAVGAVIESIKPEGQASQRSSLSTGLRLAKVELSPNSQLPVLSIPLKQILGLLRQAPRPVVLHFERPHGSGRRSPSPMQPPSPRNRSTLQPRPRSPPGRLSTQPSRRCRRPPPPPGKKQFKAAAKIQSTFRGWAVRGAADRRGWPIDYPSCDYSSHTAPLQRVAAAMRTQLPAASSPLKATVRSSPAHLNSLLQ